MSNLEIIVLAECIAAIILVIFVIGFAAFLKRRKLKRIEVLTQTGGLYDPYGLYAPVTDEDIKFIDEQARALVEKLAEEGRL